MAKSDNTYQNTKVQIPQGADRISIDSDGLFDFFGNQITGQIMANLLYNRSRSQIIINSAGVLSTVNLPSDVGLIVFSIADAASNASAWLCSGAKQGQRVILMTRGRGSAGSVKISPSGVTIIGLLSGNLSSFNLRCSNASQALVELMCVSDETWAVMDFRGNVAFNALA